MDVFTKHDIIAIFSALKTMSDEQRDYLIELDGIMGDGDLGLTMNAVFTAADTFVGSFEDDDLGVMMMKAGMVMAKAAPSTMGTLMGTGFMRGGKAVKGMHTLDAPAMNTFFEAFVQGLMDRGKAKPGDKTIIDVLYPAVMAMKENPGSLQETFAAAKQAAEEGLEATKDMVAQHGRVAYYQEKSRTLQDPGATVGSMVIAVFADYAAQ